MRSRRTLGDLAAEFCLDLLDTPDLVPTTVHMRRPTSPDPATHDHVVRRFAAACDTGDIATLEEILAADAVVVCDGAGRCGRRYIRSTVRARSPASSPNC